MIARHIRTAAGLAGVLALAATAEEATFIATEATLPAAATESALPSQARSSSTEPTTPAKKKNPGAHQASSLSDSLLIAARDAFENKRYEEVVELIDQARGGGSVESLERAYLRGAALGRLGRYADAVAELAKHRTLPGDRDMRERMRGGLALYESRLFETLAKEAIAAEKAGATPAPIDTVIAVLSFSDAGAPPRLAPLGTGLADMVITDLSQVAALVVVERTKMVKLRNEAALEQAGITTTAARGRFGRLAGAGRVVTGAFSAPDSLTIRIKGGFIEAATEKPVSAEPISGPIADFFDLEKRFVFGLIDKLGISLTDEERRAIRTIPTENLLAFLAYSEGLERADRGDFAGAQVKFAEAVSLDPSFEQARAQAEETAAAERIRREEQQSLGDDAAATVPVVYEGSGPGALQAAKPAEATMEPPAAVAVHRVGSFGAGGTLGRHISTMTGASFMTEVAVDTRGGEERIAGGVDATRAPSTTGELNHARPDYADYQGLGFGENIKRQPIIVELPEAQ